MKDTDRRCFMISYQVVISSATMYISISSLLIRIPWPDNTPLQTAVADRLMACSSEWFGQGQVVPYGLIHDYRSMGLMLPCGTAYWSKLFGWA